MDKQFFEGLANRHSVNADTAKQIYMDICKEMASRLAANEKQSCPYFVIKPIIRAEKNKTLEDGTQKSVEAKHFGRMILKGVAQSR